MYPDASMLIEMTRLRMTSSMTWWHTFRLCPSKTMIRNFVVTIGILVFIQGVLNILAFPRIRRFRLPGFLDSNWRMYILDDSHTNSVEKYADLKNRTKKSDVYRSQQSLKIKTNSNLEKYITSKFTTSHRNKANMEKSTSKLKTRNPLAGVQSCHVKPPHIVGRIPINLKVPLNWKEVEHNLTKFEVRTGGRWMPPECLSRHRVAIVIPYRDREEHLKVLLRHMHPFLQKHLLHYGIFVIEQVGDSKFNRGMLLNIGFLEARKQFRYKCFIFHDVDLIPEDERNGYDCPMRPRHMSVALDIHNYTLFYKKAFGGVTAFSDADMWTVNGYSNMYFGWGAEDDDMYSRVRAHKLRVLRPPEEFARYTMLSHHGAEKNKGRTDLLKWGRKRRHKDGLNSIRYRVKYIEYKPLYTLIKVELNKTEVYDITYTLFPAVNLTKSLRNTSLVAN